MRPLSFGGLRIHRSLSVEEVADLARCMRYKHALHGADVGGAKAGVACDPSDPELPAALAAAGHAWREALRERVVIGKDMGAGDEAIAALYGGAGCAQLAPVLARHPACPATLRELTGYREFMTGLGAQLTLEGAFGGDLADRTVAVQGFGIAGRGAAVRLARSGARVIAISDSDASWHQPDGFDPKDLAVAMTPARMIDPVRLGGARRAARDALFEIPADILVLAASSHSVSATAAHTIAATVVCETANFALTTPARAVLSERGAVTLPDIVAGSSSAAMVALQLAAGGALDDGAVWARIAKTLHDAGAEARALHEAGGPTLREAVTRRLDPA